MSSLDENEELKVNEIQSFKNVKSNLKSSYNKYQKISSLTKIMEFKNDFIVKQKKSKLIWELLTYIYQESGMCLIIGSIIMIININFSK